MLTAFLVQDRSKTKFFAQEFLFTWFLTRYRLNKNKNVLDSFSLYVSVVSLQAEDNDSFAVSFLDLISSRRF